VDMVQRLTQDIHGIAHDDNNEAGYEQVWRKSKWHTHQ
jgi:hypothetical protein